MPVNAYTPISLLCERHSPQERLPINRQGYYTFFEPTKSFNTNRRPDPDAIHLTVSATAFVEDQALRIRAVYEPGATHSVVPVH